MIKNLQIRIVKHWNVATRDHIVTTACPRCEHREILHYAGWSGWVCRGCSAVLLRPANGKGAEK